MNTVILDVSPLEGALQDFSNTWQTGETLEQRISFASPELLWKVLTAKRWSILKIMAGAGTLAIREVSRRVERDVKAVHSDIHALLDAGLLEKSEKGVIFPYDAVHIDFMLKAA